MIRRATPADIPAMAALAEAAYATYMPRLGGRPPPAMHPDFAGWIAAGRASILGDGQPAAYLLAGEGGLAGPADAEAGIDDAVWLVENIAVAPAAQGKGIGRRLMSLTEAEARAAGFARIRLVTNVVMTENQAFYARLGYREIGRRARLGTTIVDFEKRLGEGARDA